MGYIVNDVFKYYACTKDHKLVYGFDDLAECKVYCEQHGFFSHSNQYLKKHDIKTDNLDNWTDDYPEPTDEF